MLQQNRKPMDCPRKLHCSGSLGQTAEAKLRRERNKQKKMAIYHWQEENVEDFLFTGNDLMFLDAFLPKVTGRNQQETH